LVANALGDRLEVGIRFDDSDSDRCIPKGNLKIKEIINLSLPIIKIFFILRIMIYQSSLLAASFGLLSIAAASASEVPTATNPASLPQPQESTQNWAMSAAIPISDALPVAINDETKIAKSAPDNQPAEPKKWAVGVHAQASTTGFFGVDAGYKFSPNLHARLGLNTGGFNYPYSSQGIDYNTSFKPTNVHLLGDYFPFGGGLRLTGGLVFQNNRFTGSAKSNSNDQININGTNYNSSQIGTIESEGKFGNSVAPYLGIGFGTPISSGFGFNIDAGVMFAGSPTVSLAANNINPSVPAAQQAQLRSDLAAQERQTNADIKNFNLYPAISIGFSYAF
jgi:hypothetical protein